MLNIKTLSNEALSRRNFIKGGTVLGMSAAICPAAAYASTQGTKATVTSIINNPLGFNGQYQDPVTKSYFLGNGYRLYRPTLMRFNACDNLSPFGRGGVNSYAYCLGDPVNKKDPSGHFALMSIIIGAIIGAVVGASISAVAEGIRAGTTNTAFDWKEVAIGAALGFVSGGFGAAAVGAKTSVQIGLAVVDTVVSSGLSFGIDVARGESLKDAGISAGIGALVGLASFGVGKGFTAGRSVLTKYKVKTGSLSPAKLKFSKDALKDFSQLNSEMRKLLVNKPSIGKSEYGQQIININKKFDALASSVMKGQKLSADGLSQSLPPITKYFKGKQALWIGKELLSKYEHLFTNNSVFSNAVIMRPNGPFYKYIVDLDISDIDGISTWF